MISSLISKIAPKRERVKQCEDALAEMNKKLSETKAHLAEIEENIEKLKQAYDTKLAEKAELERKYVDCTVKLERAQVKI